MRTFTHLLSITRTDKNQWIYLSLILSRIVSQFWYFTSRKLYCNLQAKIIYIYIYILQETRLSVWPCRIFAEAFIFQFYPFPSGKFFGLISRDRRFRGGNRLYSIRPTELIAVIPLPPLYRIVHRSIRIFVFQFPPPPLPWFILFPPFNHRIGWARFCEKSLKSADPPSPSLRKSAEGIIFFSREIVNERLFATKIFSLS